MHKVITMAATAALMVGCFSRSPVDDERKPYTPQPQPRISQPEPRGINEPAPIMVENEAGPDLEVMPYDPNAELMPDLVDAEIEVMPFDPNAYQPGPFTALNDPEPEVPNTPDANLEILPPSSETGEADPLDTEVVVEETPSPETTDPNENLTNPGDLSPEELRLSASLVQMIAELEQRREDEEGNTVANAKALLALYLSYGVGANIDYADRASKLVHHLRERNDFRDQAWLKLQSAELDRQVGESGECAHQLHDAYLQALKLVPVDVGALYFTDGDLEQDGEFYRPRMLDDGSGMPRENTVVGVGKTFQIAFKFRFLNASNVQETGDLRYHYHLKIVPSLADEDGNQVENFRGDIFSKQFAWKAPDEYVPGRLYYNLPFDIKPGDYTLSLVFYDMNRDEPEKHPVTRNIVVRVR